MAACGYSAPDQFFLRQYGTPSYLLDTLLGAACGSSAPDQFFLRQYSFLPIRYSGKGCLWVQSSRSFSVEQFFLRQYSLHSLYSWEVSPQEAWPSSGPPTTSRHTAHHNSADILRSQCCYKAQLLLGILSEKGFLLNNWLSTLYVTGEHKNGREFNISGRTVFMSTTGKTSTNK